MTRFSLVDYYHEWADEDRADELREARHLRAAERQVCPTCHDIGGHRTGCPAAPEDDEPEAA